MWRVEWPVLLDSLLAPPEHQSAFEHVLLSPWGIEGSLYQEKVFTEVDNRQLTDNKDLGFKN